MNHNCNEFDREWHPIRPLFFYGPTGPTHPV